jgi:biopolymer transport protein ExbB
MTPSLRHTLALVLTTALLNAQEAAPGVQEKTLMDMFHQGGWVMYPLLIGSMMMVWLIIDGYMKTTKKYAYPVEQVEQIDAYFRAGDYRSAYAYSQTVNSPFADIMRAGLKMAPEGKEMTEEAMFAEIARVNGDMQGRISYLSVLGVCTPMIGLVGTVVGMMDAFDTLGTSGVGDPSKLAGAIGHVLVATASGLAVAIPSFIFYYLIRNRIADNLHDLGELVTNRFRGFPYDEVAGKTDEIGAEPPIAAAPVWNAAPETAAKA